MIDEDAARVIRWVADTPMPLFLDSINTQIPRNIIEMARRLSEEMDDVQA